ncbi:MAG: chemotaxis protein CheW [Nitrospirota bacterium]
MPETEGMKEDIAIEEAVEPSTQYCTFRFENELYGIEIDQIQEIINLQKVFPVPRAPNYIMGVINLRGNIVPVIDIKPILKLPMWKQDINSSIVLINADSNMIIGIVVDEIGDVVLLTGSKIEPLDIKKDDERSKYLTGISKLTDKVLVILDARRIIDDTKLAAA